MKSIRSLRELFSFQGFRANETLTGKFGDSKARIVTLVRRKKRVSALAVASHIIVTMTENSVSLAIRMQQVFGYSFIMKDAAYIAQGVAACE